MVTRHSTGCLKDSRVLSMALLQKKSSKMSVFYLILYHKVKCWTPFSPCLLTFCGHYFPMEYWRVFISNSLCIQTTQLSSCPYISGQWWVMILHWCHCNPFNITISNIRTRCIAITGHTVPFLPSYQPIKTPAHTNPELCFGRTWTCLILGTTAAFFQRGSDSTYKPWEQREGNPHPEFLLSLSSCLKPGNPAVKKQRKAPVKRWPRRHQPIPETSPNFSMEHLFFLSFPLTGGHENSLTRARQYCQRQSEHHS